MAFMKKVEGLSEERWAKKVLTQEGTSTWSKEISRWKKRENLENDWANMETKDIKKHIANNGLNKWQAGAAGKSSLKWYRKKQKPEKENWYQGDWGGKLLFKARSGTLEIKGRNRDGQDQNCHYCPGERETIEHLIVACRGYEAERQRLITSVANYIGQEEWANRLGEEDGGVSTILGLHRIKGEALKVVPFTKIFLTSCWEKSEQ